MVLCNTKKPGKEIKHLCLPPTIRRNSLRRNRDGKRRGNKRLFMHIVKRAIRNEWFVRDGKNWFPYSWMKISHKSDLSAIACVRGQHDWLMS